MTKYIAWLDLETDGYDDEREGFVLEVGVAVTNLKFERQYNGVFQRVLYCSEAHLETMAPVVQEMHQKTGLWDDVQRSKLLAPRVDLALREFLVQHCGEGSKLCLAGSGVAHYDKKWVWWHFPESAKLLTHWAYDIGSTRRILRDLAKVKLPGKVKGTQGIEHRALNDALAAMEETKLYVEQLRDLPGWGANATAAV